MKKLIGLALATLLLSSCNKKQPEGNEVTPTPKVTPDKPEPPKPTKSAGLASVPVTSKSPDAIKAFENARTLLDNQHGDDAIAPAKKAIETDPDFAQAHALLGILTDGADGMPHLEKAVALSAKLPEAERLLIESAHAMRSGDRKKATTLMQKIAQLAPGDWRTLLLLADAATGDANYDAAIKLYEQALGVKADLAIAHNGLAYVYGAQRKWELAIASAKKQVELLPKEANPQDTLGEIQLQAGKFADAEPSFQAALTVDPKFVLAWQGIAMSRAYRGDFKGAYEALEKQKALVTLPRDRMAVALDTAWIKVAENKLPDAIAILDTIETAPDKKIASYAFAAMARGFMFQNAGKYADAEKWFENGRARAEVLPGAGKRAMARNHAIGMLRTAALTNKPADADKWVAAIDADAALGGADPSFPSWAHGLQIWAKSGPKDAVAELSKCREDILPCRHDLARAQRKAGDTAGADATEKQLRDRPTRDFGMFFLWTTLPKK